MQRKHEEACCQIESKVQTEDIKDARKAQEEDIKEAAGKGQEEEDIKEAEVSKNTYFQDLVILLLFPFRLFLLFIYATARKGNRNSNMSVSLLEIVQLLFFTHLFPF